MLDPSASPTTSKKQAAWKSFWNFNLKLGSRDARQSVLSYDDAVKRINQNDLHRLKKAFRKDAVGDYLPKDIFLTRVLGDAVPLRLAESMYAAFGGTQRGVSLKELVAGLVLLSCGTQEEKLHLLFHLCAGGAQTMPISDLIAIIKTSEDGTIPEHLVHAFAAHSTITAEQFRVWIAQYWNSMSLTKWLLENDFKPELVSEPGHNEIPTFYQTLAGVTHLEEKDIFELERFYESTRNLRSNHGRYDVSLFASLVSPPLSSGIVVNLFQAFDENGDGHLDLKEIVCGVSACCRGPAAEQQKFCYKVFDIRRKRQLSLDEIVKMLSVLMGVDEDSPRKTDGEQLKYVAEDILDHYAENGLRALTLDGFLVWALKTNMTARFMRILFQVCHIVLGLRPQTRDEELACVIEWLQRDGRRQKNVGDVYYVVPMDWWRAWRRFVEDMSGSDYVSDTDTLPGRKKSNGLNDRLQELVTKLPSRQGSRAGTPTLSRSSSTMSVQARHPGSINTQSLLVAESKYKSLTDEGGVLKKRSDGGPLRENEDYILVCEAVWKVLSLWYTVSGPEIPRQCVQYEDGEVDVDVLLVCLKVLKHKIVEINRPYNSYPYGSAVAGSHFAYVANNGASQRTMVERMVFATVCFSAMARFAEMHECLCRKLRLPVDDVRLWLYRDENDMLLVEDESVTVGLLNLKDGDQILLETRNKDLTWPEEMTFLREARRTPIARAGSISRVEGGYEEGCCGLNNLGNTCFMNAALQCISHSQPLTYYFRQGYHARELNRRNPIGYGGVIAERYAELIGQLWNGKLRTVAPHKLRMSIGKHKPSFNGYQQHDSQELLAFLLDGLHEDLNRVQEKPYVELNDSEGRQDEVVAAEAWENHLRRNQSIIIDLFHGLLKSRVKCLTCTKASVRFDPFSVLSLPLPLDNLVFWEVYMARCNGQGPIKYGLRIDPESTFGQLRTAFAGVSGLHVADIIPVEIHQGLVRRYFNDTDKVQGFLPRPDTRLLMYQLPPHAGGEPAEGGGGAQRWVVAVHRRMIHNDSYYLAWAKAVPRTFGLPVFVMCSGRTTQRELYENVWMQIKRFIGPDTAQTEDSNHAQECDAQCQDYSFVLKVVREDGCWCGVCPWYRFCRGCPLAVSDDLFHFVSGTLVIDWEPRFYHLRYQECLEYIVEEDDSVKRARAEQAEPISLDSCLKAFTHEEELGADALYHCSSCHKRQLASKRMQLWKLPPVLAVHFKRFQKVREHWVKSHKVVTFPLTELDLSNYLAAPDAPMTPVQPDPEAADTPTKPPRTPDTPPAPGMNGEGDGDSSFSSGVSGGALEAELLMAGTVSAPSSDSGQGDTGEESTWTSVSGGSREGLRDIHQHHLLPGTDVQDLKYDLYAFCSHSGLLATGHYVAYCRNPNGKWYLFNDSSCKEVPVEQLGEDKNDKFFFKTKIFFKSEI
ncbi:ubiquitin carboxyl-terminal hydrolase 32-like isoform X2 [Paramacrobiotus metropolitanus]|uniref:ubiquitin carboxyl-terminal hydrolase 32-like isoform X2 n=1 Tax=Paramacrobiotus metropolitanus TaxID=2943436 RepID=UPI00244618F9|nr:ubiquitin carboxyl-terminal hydrolase 32-like isoform X2 [Paramacrobiotus metropolitanus]